LAFSHPSNFAPLMLVDPEFLLLFAILIPAVFQFTRQSRLDRMVGELSYPLYLSHMGVGAALSLWTPPNALTAYGGYFGSALLVSAGLLVVIDIPVSRLRAWLFGARQEPQSPPDPVLPIAAAA
jgi:peptidoglycan/LPS O-acetylase OafA/YrhL